MGEGLPKGIPLTTVLPTGLLPTPVAFLFQNSLNSLSWEVPYFPFAQ